MESKSAVGAYSASRSDSLKKSAPQDHAEFDLAQQVPDDLDSARNAAPALPEEEPEPAADKEPLTVYLKGIRVVQLLAHQQQLRSPTEAGEARRKLPRGFERLAQKLGEPLCLGILSLRKRKDRQRRFRPRQRGWFCRFLRLERSIHHAGATSVDSEVRNRHNHISQCGV